MISKTAIIVAALSITLPAAAAPETYVADPGHTIPSFEVLHAGGFTTVRGFFQKSTGKITLDRVAKSGAIEIVVETASVNTANSRRDELVRGWFKTGEFPTMIYRSSNLKFSGDTLIGADGELTLLGVTKPVSLTVTSFKCRPHPVNKKDQCGADGMAQIKRSEFGMTNAMTAAGDEIKILFEIEASKE